MEQTCPLSTARLFKQQPSRRHPVSSGALNGSPPVPVSSEPCHYALPLTIHKSDVSRVDVNPRAILVLAMPGNVKVKVKVVSSSLDPASLSNAALQRRAVVEGTSELCFQRLAYISGSVLTASRSPFSLLSSPLRAWCHRSSFTSLQRRPSTSPFLPPEPPCCPASPSSSSLSSPSSRPRRSTPVRPSATSPLPLSP